MSALAYQPPPEPQLPGGFVPIADYHQVVKERDHWKRTAHETQEKLSALVYGLQRPELTWKQRVAPLAAAVAIEGLRPKDNPRAEFHADLGQIARRAGFIPPTDPDDKEAGAKAFQSGRKLAGQVVKEFAEQGVIDGRFVTRDQDDGGKVANSAVIIQIERTGLEVVRAAARREGTRTLQKARGVHTKIDPHCPACGSSKTRLQCQSCGSITDTRDILEEMDRKSAETGFQTLETGEDSTDFKCLEILGTYNTGEKDILTGFQTLETGEQAPAEESSHITAPAPEGTKPTYLAPEPAGIPVRLMGRPQWVVWRLDRVLSRVVKVPYAPQMSGVRAKTDIPYTWGTCAQALEQYRAGGFDGIGYVFSADDPFTGVDLDDMDAGASEIVAELNSYTERSPSGRGVHSIVEASKPGERCRAGTVEMYDHGRFFAITGHRLDGTPAAIEPRQAELDAVYARLFPDPPPPPPALRSASTSSSDVLEKALRAKNGDKTRRLMAGDWSGYPSQSEADAALCALLRYWGADDDQIDSIFRTSGLYREKWDRPDYRERTIRKVLDNGN